MRAFCVLSLLLVLVPAIASAQSPGSSFSIQAAAGPTIVDSGHTVAAAVGFSPWSRVTFLLDVQRTRINSRTTRTDSTRSEFRGGTMTAVSGEVRVGLWPANRMTPYVLAGLGRGESRPTVNEVFPDPVTNEVGFLFFGAGVHVPVRDHLSFFGDVRVVGGAEGYDSMIVLYPVRVGMALLF